MIFVYLCIALYIIVTAWCFLDIIKDGENMVDNDNIPADAYKNYGRAFVISDRKPMTNADRIRSMTDEELAEWFAGHDAGLIANVLNNDYVEPTKDGWLEWLETGV